MRPMNLDDLIAVERIARYGSISAAASRMHLSSSSLGRTLKKVEGELGVALFRRNGKHLVLNRYGKIALYHAGIAEKVMDKAIDDIRRYQERQDRLLRVYFRHNLGNTSAVLAPFIRENPRIRLDIILSDAEAARKGYDLEFFSSREKPMQEASVLLGEERYVLVVDEHHRLKNASSVSVRDLERETFVIPPLRQGGNLLDDICRSSGWLPAKRIECPQVWGALQYVESGMGVLIAPEFSMLSGFDSDVVKIPLVIEGESFSKRYLYIAWQPDCELGEGSLRFIEYLRAFFAQAPSVWH